MGGGLDAANIDVDLGTYPTISEDLMLIIHLTSITTPFLEFLQMMVMGSNTNYLGCKEQKIWP